MCYSREEILNALKPVKPIVGGLVLIFHITMVTACIVSDRVVFHQLLMLMFLIDC